MARPTSQDISACCEAAKRNDVEALRSLLLEGKLAPSQLHEEHLTKPLMAAIYQGAYEAVEVLLDCGADALSYHESRHVRSRSSWPHCAGMLTSLHCC